MSLPILPTGRSSARIIIAVSRISRSSLLATTFAKHTPPHPPLSHATFAKRSTPISASSQSIRASVITSTSARFVGSVYAVPTACTSICATLTVTTRFPRFASPDIVRHSRLFVDCRIPFLYIRHYDSNAATTTCDDCEHDMM